MRRFASSFYEHIVVGILCRWSIGLFHRANDRLCVFFGTPVCQLRIGVPVALLRAVFDDPFLGGELPFDHVFAHAAILLSMGVPQHTPSSYHSASL